MPEGTDQTQDIEQQETVPENPIPEAVLETAKSFDALIDTESDEQDSTEAPAAKDEAKDTEAKETTKPAEEKPDGGVSDALREKALAAGLNEDEVGSFTDDASLQKTIDIIEAVVAGSDQKDASTQSAAEDEQKDEAGKKPGFDFEFEDRDDIDPELLANMEKMRDHYEGEIESLRKEVRGLLGTMQKTERDQFVERFDGMIDGLGLEWADTFGKGKTRDLSQSSKAYQSRDAVRSRMYAFAKGMIDSGETPPSEEALFKLAMTSLHSERMSTIEAARLTTKTTKRSKQRIGRPSSKQSGPLVGDQKAYETSRKFDEMIDTSEDF